MLLRVLRLRRVRTVRVAAPPQVWTARQRLERAALSTTRELHAAPSALTFTRSPAVRLHARLLNTSVAANSTPALTQETLVQELKVMCNAMRNDHDERVAPPVQEIVESWATQVASFKEQAAGASDASAFEREMRLGYESAIAIASKQRQFDLATALFEQMQALEFVPTDATFKYIIRDVALELLARPYATPVEALRAIVPESTWERDLLEIIKTEEYAHHRKTPIERKRFHEQLLGGIETHLDAYEATVAVANRSSVPYNQALRVYASNGVPFTRMLQLMVKRSVMPDAETYAALLQGARWSEIPATLSQLLQSGLVERLTADAQHADAAVALESSNNVHTLWVNTMKAVLHSYNNKFFDRKQPVSHDDVLELQKVFLYAEKQLTRAFPQFQFATSEQHNAVYAIRAKAAATAGLSKNVLHVLDEYLRLAPTGATLTKQPFLCALELYPSSQLEILHLPREVVQERALHRDVARSRRVSELERVHARLADKVLPASIAKLDRMTADPSADARTLAEQKKLVATHTRSEQAMARRLNNARIVKSYQLLIQEQFERADKATDAVERKLRDAAIADASVGASSTAACDLDVACKLLEQYMTCANRFEQRLRSRQKEIAPQLMRRVFRVVKQITRDDLTALDEAQREQLSEAFHLAIRTAVLLWRFDDAGTLVRKKKRALAAPLLDAREYELLIFQHVADRNIQGAYALVQEMHNAGLAPPKEAIHRIVLGVLHKLRKYPDEADVSGLIDDVDGGEVDTATTKFETETDTEDIASGETDAELAADRDMLESSDTHTIEAELAFSDELTFEDDNGDSVAQLVLGSGAPTSVVDLVGFLQDWYNLHRIRPAAKTVVPVFAHLLASRDMAECKRLLQILESMDCGLTPATTLWLEKRLARVGKTLDDLRVRPASRR